METKTLYSPSANEIKEITWDRPEMADDQIEIKTLFCGVCRSDIGSYARWEEMPPGSTERDPKFGHEGVGVVTKVGANVTGVKEGDYVSTWSDPAYSDYYYAKRNEFVVVPEASHKYILQPVACAMNIFHKTQLFMNSMGYQNEPILLLGTGFMSIVIGQYCANNNINLTVVGNSNKEIWNSMGYSLHSVNDIINNDYKYKVIIDLTSKAEMFDIITKQIAALEALICYAATPSKPVTTNFFDNCWNCHTLIMPSPRNNDFNEVMAWTRDVITYGILDVDKLWSKEYNRNDMNEVKQAFEDGKVRIKGYLRGYLSWK